MSEGKILGSVVEIRQFPGNDREFGVACWPLVFVSLLHLIVEIIQINYNFIIVDIVAHKSLTRTSRSPFGRQ